MATIYSLFCPICCKVFCCNISCSEASPGFLFGLTRGDYSLKGGALLSRDHAVGSRLLDLGEPGLAAANRQLQIQGPARNAGRLLGPQGGLLLTGARFERGVLDRLAVLGV
jgi:hypothetical protein